MGKKMERTRSKTLPSSPSHSFSSSSSSDFEFRISVSPRKSSANLCPADELFYKGQLLPLHLSPRISMVRTLLLSSSSTSSSATTARDSSSSTDSSASTSSFAAADLHLLTPGDPCCDSSRPSSVTDDDDLLKHRLNHNHPSKTKHFSSCKYFSFTRIFKKDPSKTAEVAVAKKMSSSAKEVIGRYLKKVKPLYERLSQKQHGVRDVGSGGASVVKPTAERSDRESGGGGMSSFSGSLKCPRMIRRSYVASCPSSMRSSPSHSGVLTRGGLPGRIVGSGSCSSDTATMEELQNAIQGAITHCKNSMIQQNSAGFNHQSNSNSYKCKAKEI